MNNRKEQMQQRRNLAIAALNKEVGELNRTMVLEVLMASPGGVNSEQISRAVGLSQDRVLNHLRVLHQQGKAAYVGNSIVRVHCLPEHAAAILKKQESIRREQARARERKKTKKKQALRAEIEKPRERAWTKHSVWTPPKRMVSSVWDLAAT